MNKIVFIRIFFTIITTLWKLHKKTMKVRKKTYKNNKIQLKNLFLTSSEVALTGTSIIHREHIAQLFKTRRAQLENVHFSAEHF